MTKEQEKFLDELIDDLYKLTNENSSKDIISYLVSKYHLNIGQEEFDFIEEQVAERMGYKNILGWQGFINDELYERSKTCFQDILALRELYKKEEKARLLNWIHYLIYIFELIKINQEITEEIERSDTDFRELLIGCCFLDLATIQNMDRILNSTIQDFLSVKADSHSIAIEYWIYNYLLKFIRVFLDGHIFNTQKQQLFPFRESDESNDLERQMIFERAKRLKDNGMKVDPMFENMRDWLLNHLNFTEEEIKEKYDIGLEDLNSFNKLVNKHTSHYK